MDLKVNAERNCGQFIWLRTGTSSELFLMCHLKILIKQRHEISWLADSLSLLSKSRRMKDLRFSQHWLLRFKGSYCNPRKTLSLNCLTLKMGLIMSFEMVETTRPKTRRHVPEDLNPVLHVRAVFLIRIHVTCPNLLEEFTGLSEPRWVMMPLCKVGTALT